MVAAAGGCTAQVRDRRGNCCRRRSLVLEPTAPLTNFCLDADAPAGPARARARSAAELPCARLWVLGLRSRRPRAALCVLRLDEGSAPLDAAGLIDESTGWDVSRGATALALRGLMPLPSLTHATNPFLDEPTP